MSNKHYLISTGRIGMGSVSKSPLELVSGETILAYDPFTATFELTTISEVNQDEEAVEHEVVKIDKLASSFTSDAIIFVKDGFDNILYGYFTEEKPVIDGIDPDKLVNVLPGIHRYFNGTDWVVIENIEKYQDFGYLHSFKLENNDGFFADNVLISHHSR